MSQWLPYDEATLNQLLHTNRDVLAAWLDDRRTLGQLVRWRGFTDQRALARRLVAARGDHPRGARRRVLERRARHTVTHQPARAALNRAGPGRASRMTEANDREDDAVPDEDPRQTGAADQMPEENPEGQGAGGGERQKRTTGNPDAPDHSTGDGPESDPGRATGNPRSAG